MSDRLPKQKKLIPISEAAKVLGVSIDTIRRWDKSGILHSVRADNKNRYFFLDELEAHKSDQPLPISQAALELGISPVTLRRLEARGLLKPNRNSAGERVYDKNSLKNFLNSNYYLRRKQLKEKLSEPIKIEAKSLKHHSAIPDFLAISITLFLLLITLGVGNIKLSEVRISQPTPPTAVLGQTVATPEPANTQDVTLETTSEATSAASLEASSILTSETAPEAKIIVNSWGESSSIIIYQEPTTNSEKIGKASNNETFEFVSLDSGWYEVKLADGSTGFISEKYAVREDAGN